MMRSGGTTCAVLIALTACADPVPVVHDAHADSAAVLRAVLEERLGDTGTLVLDARFLLVDSFDFAPPFSHLHMETPPSPMLQRMARELEGITLSGWMPSGLVASVSVPILRGDSAYVFHASSYFGPGRFESNMWRATLVRSGAQWRVIQQLNAGHEHGG